jgi:hypothetical protein
MKTRFSKIIALALIMICLLVILPTPALASKPVELTINADLWMTGENSAAGTFETTGLFTANGEASETFFIAAETIHGVKVMEDLNGTITILFQAHMTWTGPTNGVAEGHFVVVSGTGAYKKLHGVGDSYAELNLATYHILASYTGTAHFD